MVCVKISSERKEIKMEVLFATKNPAKIKRYASKLEQKGIKI